MLLNRSNSKSNNGILVIRKKTQHGNVLILSLVLLGVLSLLGLSSLRGSLTEEKISINIQDRHFAIEGAKSSARFAEQQLRAIDTTSSAFYDTWNNEAIPDLTTWVIGGSSLAVDQSMWATGAQAPPIPQFKIERFAQLNQDLEGSTGGEDTDKQGIRATTYFRIIARGQGRSANSSAITESIVIRQ